MKGRLHPLLALGCLFAAGWLSAQTSPPPSMRVLFLGNSLTDGNDVPELVRAMARLQGVELFYDAYAPGGYALEDHWTDGRQALLRQGDYDMVILQQGPSTLPESQVNLREWTVAWTAEAWRYGTLSALYMIWPVRTQANGFALVSQSYRNAAVAANALVFPAGEAWEQALRLDPSLQLYSSDNLHATPAGSFLAAMVIARGLVKLDPARVPNTVAGVTVSTANLTVFRNVVAALPTDANAATAPVTPPTPGSTTPTPTPAASSTANGGGGAYGAGFLVTLAVAGATRFLASRTCERCRG